ncbi:MAG TPA: hypothetical protein VLA56_01990 [Pseudomonadales bacterium]|nr:hypothetical protein [Pseudomonadales bacterium]
MSGGAGSDREGLPRAPVGATPAATSSATRLGLAFWATTPWLLGFAVPAMDPALAPAGRRGAAVVVLMALGAWLLGGLADRQRAAADRADPRGRRADRLAPVAAVVTGLAALLVIALPQTPLAPLGIAVCGAAGIGLLLR